VSKYTPGQKADGAPAITVHNCFKYEKDKCNVNIKSFCEIYQHVPPTLTTLGCRPCTSGLAAGPAIMPALTSIICILGRPALHLPKHSEE